MSTSLNLKNSISTDEEERLNKLYTYEILDTPAETTFDKIAALAALTFKKPIAQINFVDKEKVFLKANLSPSDDTEMDRKDSFCALTIASTGVTVFEDTHKNPAIADKILARTNNTIRFYAGAPLKTREGYQIGTVCVLDTVPGHASSEQLKTLELLSEIVIDELELRLAARKAVRIQTDLVNRVVHDLKNPSTTIKLSADLIRLKLNEPEMVKDMASRITTSSITILKHLNELLDLSQMEVDSYILNIQEVELGKLLHKVKRNFELVATKKNQTITLVNNAPIIVSADADKLQDVFENLLSNALKYSEPNKDIRLSYKIENKNAVIAIKDSGQGLSPEDMEKLFTKFAKLSSRPTGKEHSNGLGLFIVKTIVDLHKGNVWATSAGKGNGSCFYISLPLSGP